MEEKVTSLSEGKKQYRKKTGETTPPMSPPGSFITRPKNLKKKEWQQRRRKGKSLQKKKGVCNERRRNQDNLTKGLNGGVGPASGEGEGSRLPIRKFVAKATTKKEGRKEEHKGGA